MSTFGCVDVMGGAVVQARCGPGPARVRCHSAARSRRSHPKDKPRNPRRRAGNLLASCRWFLRAPWLNPTHAALAVSPGVHMHIHVIVAVQCYVYAGLFVATNMFSRAYALAEDACANQ